MAKYCQEHTDISRSCVHKQIGEINGSFGDVLCMIIDLAYLEYSFMSIHLCLNSLFFFNFGYLY